MAAYFFDSSALAKRFLKEAGTAFVLGLLRPTAGHAIYAARLSEVESNTAPNIALNQVAKLY
jgi:PIN domain nuclease of toxin-antitoxin system